ncbi:MAG: AAA family ATPase [Gammaproteobacteria bacterium]
MTAEQVQAPSSYQAPDGLRQRLDLIHHLLEFGRQIVVVTGAVGSGRSRLLDELADELSPVWVPVRVDARLTHTPDELLHTLGVVIGVGEDGYAQDLEHQCMDALARLRAARRRCLLLLDDADDIDEPLVALLCRLAFWDEEEGGIRLLATALPDASIVQRLEACAPHAALVHVVDVPPLPSATIAALIEDWCEERDLPRAAALDDDALAALQRTCAGNPGRALELLSAHLAAVPTGSPAGVAGFVLSPRLQRLGGIAIVVLAAVALVALAIGNRWSPREVDQVNLDNAPAVIELPLPVAAPERMDATAGPEGGQPGMVEPPERVAPPAPAAVGEAPPAASDVVAVVTETAVNGEPRGGEASERRSSAGEAAPAEPVPAPPSDASQTRVAPAARDTAPREDPYTAEWVLTQRDDAFVIQLFGSHSREAAGKYVTSRGVVGRTAIVERVHDGRPWYVVVYGHYRQRAAATAAIADLPAVLRGDRPWPRTVGSLKN